MIRLTALLFAMSLTLAACAPSDPPAADAPADETSAAPAATPSAPARTATTDLPPVTVYKTPTCGCCAMWVDHLREAGFAVEAVDLPSLNPIKAEHGIAPELQSCHTAVVDGYVVEGHVPADDIKRLLAERPDARGLAVPGMPIGSPGMEVPGRPADAYDVLLLGEGAPTVFARH